jgi:hypothetical protein
LRKTVAGRQCINLPFPAAVADKAPHDFEVKDKGKSLARTGLEGPDVE